MNTKKVVIKIEDPSVIFVPLKRIICLSDDLSIFIYTFRAGLHKNLKAIRELRAELYEEMETFRGIATACQKDSVMARKAISIWKCREAEFMANIDMATLCLRLSIKCI